MWWDQTNMQYAAITAVNSNQNPESVAEGIKENAAQIKTRSGWFGELNSEIRYIIAAMLYQHGDSPDAYMDELERVRAMFRQYKIRRGSMYEIVAITILRLCGKHDGVIRPISETQLDRFQEIYSEMSKNQWWLTSVDDFPACSIMTLQPGVPSEIAAQSEAIYQALVANGYWKGNALQSVANMLFLVQDHPANIAGRFYEIAQTFKAKRVRIWQGEYDEVAVLAFSNDPAESIVDRVLEIQKELITLKPRIYKHIAFNLACSLAFIESAQSRQTATVTSAKAMMDLNAIIAAQQAAIMASTVAASVAASTAASSG